jgi:RNA polymerase sigma-70 factor (ECF subfamily)
VTNPLDPLSPALQTILTRFAELLRRVGTKYRLSGADVDELIQEVRIRLWTSQRSGELIRAISASYMYQTAVTAALTIIRRRRAKTSGSDAHLDSANELRVLRVAESPADELETRELGEEIERALTTLPPQRAPVVRLYLAGYSREEIAELFGWTEGKTRNLLYRGLDDLRSVLNERGVGPRAAR